MVMRNALDASPDVSALKEFRLDGGVPVWRYEVNGGVVEKRICMPYRQNTVVIQYRVTGASPLKLRLTPAVHFRNYEAPVSEALHDDYSFTASGEHFSLSVAGLPPLRF